ncbi:hypothetical protein EGI32_19835 [Ferruginibacter sp. HRS2-29]|nr:hypothetical protein [Ferruginibacter sp. HRS2-29]
MVNSEWSNLRYVVLRMKYARFASLNIYLDINIILINLPQKKGPAIYRAFIIHYELFIIN